jgi:hypothetical protein
MNAEEYTERLIKIRPVSIRHNIDNTIAILQGIELPLREGVKVDVWEPWNHMDETKWAKFFVDITDAIDCLNQARNRFTSKMIDKATESLLTKES